MNKKYYIMFFLVFFCINSNAYADGIGGKTYYTMVIDMSKIAFQHFNWTFENGNIPDNETSFWSDNMSQGGITIFEDVKTFDNQTGTYVAKGSIFRGTWTADEVNYSTFYEADIYTHYSFLFFGVPFAKGAFITGIIYSDTIIESIAKDTEKIESTIPFLGFLVGESESNKIIKNK